MAWQHLLPETLRLRERILGETHNQNIAMTVAILLVILPVVLPCDNTLYLGSNGMICDNSHCIRSDMFDLTLESGSPLCFRDASGELMVIRMKNAGTTYSSNRVYKTASFSLDVKTLWQCKGQGLCWAGSCHRESAHPNLVQPTNNLTITG